MRKIPRCIICGRGEKEGAMLIGRDNGCICTDCVENIHNYLHEMQPAKGSKQFAAQVKEDFKLLSPKEIHKYLDQYVIGQEEDRNRQDSSGPHHSQDAAPSVCHR